MATRQRVFLATDRFEVSDSYYVVARDADEAQDIGRNTDFPRYLPRREEGDRFTGWLGCEVEEDEVETLLLVKTSTLGRKRPQRVRLIVTASNEERYRGYRVLREEVVMEEKDYPRREWQPAIAFQPHGGQSLSKGRTTRYE